MAMWREMLPAGIGVGIAMAIVSAIGIVFATILRTASVSVLFH